MWIEIISIIMYTFILRLAIRMYTIELGKTSKTELVFSFLCLYIRELGGLAAQEIKDYHCTFVEPFRGAIIGYE